MGPATLPNSAFIEKLNRVAQVQPAPVADLTVGGDAASEGTASPTSTSGREGSKSSESTAPVGESIQSRQQGHSRPLRTSGILVYRMANMEMVDRADTLLVYTVDYFTSAVTAQYLESLREEFGIPNDVEMIVPGPNDLPSRPPPGYVILSVEFFRVGLRLPFHPNLRRALRRLNVASMQLNANAFRNLISYFVLWTKNYAPELPFRAFQNLYRMKTADNSRN
ncbi:hypothetical protein TIFTF001_035188 [Ficus carica]|uniref:Uncharacterized protein n=1 Tax=Ficus carica TaxID=3494 RepID=A0AA88E152_FICCA|nr:hypothetical protein TIFTF001_035179 [Ficus carica]GMN66117.1 hypothetical protein TIFTF001_035188 [Ficus carica]